VGCNFDGSLAPKIYVGRIRLGFHTLPFFFKLDISNDQSDIICFISDNMGFLRWSRPKFQDCKVGRRIDKMFGCCEFSNWVFVPSIFSTSSISSSRSMGACWKCAPKTLLPFITWVYDVVLATPSSSSLKFDTINVGLPKINFGVGCQQLGQHQIRCCPYLLRVLLV